MLQFVFNTGLALIMARMGGKTPDLAQLMPFVLRTWMYASGVMFSIPVMLRRQAASGSRRPAVEPGGHLHGPDALRADRRLRLGEPAAARVGASPAAGPAVAGVGGFVYFWKAEERYGRG